MWLSLRHNLRITSKGQHRTQTQIKSPLQGQQQLPLDTPQQQLQYIPHIFWYLFDNLLYLVGLFIKRNKFIS